MAFSDEQINILQDRSKEFFTGLYELLNQNSDFKTKTESWAEHEPFFGLHSLWVAGLHNIWGLNHYSVETVGSWGPYDIKDSAIQVQFQPLYEENHGYDSNGKKQFDGIVRSLFIEVRWPKIITEEIEKKGFFGTFKKKIDTYKIELESFFPFISPEFDNDINFNFNIDDFLDFVKNFKAEFDLKTEIIIQIISFIKNQIIIVDGIIAKNNAYIVDKIRELDSNGDGIIDKLEKNEFSILFQKNQRDIIEIDRNYIQKFVQLSNFLNSKKGNLQSLFADIKNSNNFSEVRIKGLEVLFQDLESYNDLVFHSINMIVSLVSGDMISFYEIYESFDKFGMFNSNWEKEVKENLLSINNNLESINYSIYNFEQNILNALGKLTYVTQSSFDELSRQVKRQLNEIR